MGSIVQLFLCLTVGCLAAARSLINEQDDIFLEDFPDFFDDFLPFPFRRDFAVTPFDTIFSSWRTRAPDFHLLGDLPPLMNVPRVEVFCDESKLTVAVDKRARGFPLTRQDMWLGDGCYSNQELPNQLVFTYGLDECGTTRKLQNGVEVFTNSLHLNLQKHLRPGWRSHTSVHVSCLPKRSYDRKEFLVPAAPEKSKTFTIKAMNPSWTSTGETNVYRRGQVVNLQVSARTRPGQQLYVQSCFVSASPDPHARPKHAVIMNKGCTAPLGSPHAVVQFVASDRVDVVNLALNTSYLISELYFHCNVLISDLGVTSGSKSCNYNLIKSRWEDVSGTVEVCECCSSKCKSLPAKHTQEDVKAIVSTGPVVIVDKGVQTSPGSSLSGQRETSSAPPAMQSARSAPEDTIMSVSQRKFPPPPPPLPPQGVLVLNQDPVTRLTLWLPGEVQEVEHSENVAPDNFVVEVQADGAMLTEIPELQLATPDWKAPLNTPTNNIGDQKWNFLTLVDGWAIPPPVEKAAIAEESKRKMWSGRSGRFGTQAPQEVDVPLLEEKTPDILNDLNLMKDEPTPDAAVEEHTMKNEASPIIRSKLEFSKTKDGSKKLSYEQEVVRRPEGKGVVRMFGKDGGKEEKETKGTGMFSAFLDLLRKMDRAE